MKEVKKTTKKTKSETKKKQTKKTTIEKPKLTEKSKITIIALSIIPILLIFGIIISAISPAFSEFYWINIQNPITGFLFNLFDFAPRLGAKYSIIVIVILTIMLVLNIYYEFSKKLPLEKRTKGYNITTVVYVILLYILITPMIINSQSFTHPKISETYFKELQDIEYSKDDIVNLNKYFIDEILKMSDDFDRENNSIIYKENLMTRAVTDLKNISNKYEFLKGQYPLRAGEFSKSESENNLEGTLAYTQGYGIIVDYSYDKVGVLNTIAHELCHSKGILREAETEYCAFLSGVNSKEKLSQYSALYNAYYRTASALSSIDEELNKELEEEFLNVCLEKGYKEICDFYPKDIKGYINGTDYLTMETLRLRNYKKHQEELISFLETLSKEKNITFTIGNEEISKQDLINITKEEIINDSKKTLIIDIKINEKKYNALKETLQKNQNYFKYAYLIDEEYDYPEYKTGKDAEEFYTKPFNESDFKLIANDEFMDEYDYDRVTRLYLEHYTGTIINKNTAK